MGDSDGILLSQRDHDRLQALLRSYENGQLNRPRELRRRRVAGDGGTSIRKAYCKDFGEVSNTVICYLDTDLTGEEITVECEIVGGTALISAVPRLEVGKLLWVTNDSGTWRHVGIPFNGSEDCP